jgi:DNA-binding response OmpR family regulator
MNERQSRILVVDDEPCVTALLSRYCRGEGYEVSVAGSAEEAIDLTGAANFDLIILDIVLPGLSGFAALRVLKQSTDAPILMMSGCADLETRKDALLMGALDLIDKPLKFQNLMSILHALPRLQ